MTGQWAEALVKGGVDTLEELLAKKLDQLTAIFEKARAGRLIATAPDGATLLEIAKDAAAVFHGGQCMGTVLSTDGRPVRDAVVTVGGRTTETDERGRYRLIRIPAASSHYLKIERAGYRTLFEPDFEVAYDCRAVGAQYRTLAPSETQHQTPEIDEYDGDELPGLSSYRTVSRPFAQEEIRQGDVFRVHELYASSQHAKLVSIFRAYRAGDLIVRHVKVDLSRFTETPAKGDLYRYQNGAFVKGSNTTRAIERHRALRKLGRNLREYPEFYRLDLAGQVDWLFKTYSEKNIFSRFKPAPSGGS
jgi:hypothetical protein